MWRIIPRDHQISLDSKTSDEWFGETYSAHPRQSSCKMCSLFCPKRRIDRLDEDRPAQIRMARRPRLVLVHHVAKTNAPVSIRKTHGATRAPVPEGPWRWAKRLQTEPRFAKVFGHRQQESESEP